MANMMQDASQWLSDQIDAHASSNVTYKRGSLSVIVPAGKARTVFESNDSNGILISVESRDFLISASSLLLNGSVILPEVGDCIVEVNNGESHKYEVNNFGGEQPYRLCDPFGHKLRVHTKYVGVVL